MNPDGCSTHSVSQCRCDALRPGWRSSAKNGRRPNLFDLWCSFFFAAAKHTAALLALFVGDWLRHHVSRWFGHSGVHCSRCHACYFLGSLVWIIWTSRFKEDRKRLADARARIGRGQLLEERRIRHLLQQVSVLRGPEAMC